MIHLKKFIQQTRFNFNVIQTFKWDPSAWSLYDMFSGLQNTKKINILHFFKIIYKVAVKCARVKYDKH